MRRYYIEFPRVEHRRVVIDPYPFEARDNRAALRRAGRELGITNGDRRYLGPADVGAFRAKGAIAIRRANGRKIYPIGVPR